MHLPLCVLIWFHSLQSLQCRYMRFILVLSLLMILITSLFQVSHVQLWPVRCIFVPFWV